MKRHIITGANIQNHKVENYRFKVLLDDSAQQDGFAGANEAYIANENYATNEIYPTNEIYEPGSLEGQDNADEMGASENSQDGAQESAQDQGAQAVQTSASNAATNEIYKTSASNNTTNEIRTNVPRQAQGFMHEEMLKKIETLSENVIKLQMQIESNEQEFQKRLETELATAKQNAYDEGKNDASKHYQEELEKLNEKFLKSIEKLDKKSTQLDEYMQKAESELSAMAIEIAKQTIAIELGEHSSKIAYALSTELTSQLKKDSKVKISVNPKDYSFIKDKYENTSFEIIADDAINIGCVMVLSDELNAEASIKDRLDKIKNMVLKD